MVQVVMVAVVGEEEEVEEDMEEETETVEEVVAEETVEIETKAGGEVAIEVEVEVEMHMMDLIEILKEAEVKEATYVIIATNQAILLGIVQTRH